METQISQTAGVPCGALEAVLTPTQRAVLSEHVVQGVPILPGAAGLALALAAARSAAGGPVCLREVRFDSAVLVEREGDLRLRVRPHDARGGFVVEALDALGVATPHARGRIEAAPAAIHAPEGLPLDDEAARGARFEEAREGGRFYAALHANGNEYGPLFQGVERLWTRAGEALGKLRAGDPALLQAFGADVAALDAALHVLAAPATAAGACPAFVLASIGTVVLPPGARPAWSFACFDRDLASDAAPAGDVWLFDAAGRPAGHLLGVRLAWLGAARPGATETLAVAATFTAEPVTDALDFWAQELGLPLRVRHAPFNQVFQQLLDPASLLRSNRAGADVLLLRLEDWAPDDSHAAAPAARLEVREGVATRRLPNGLEVAHLNAYETDYLYQEIFVDRVYARHGVTFEDGDCVFDVGANIGLFSLFARGAARGVSVFAFEPSPRLAPVIAANAGLAGGVRVFHCGVSDRDGSAAFTFYARSSVFSGYHADATQDQAALRAVIDNMLARGGLADPLERADAVEHFLAGRLEAEVAQCPLRTLSSVIDEYGVARIDLLKVDAEKSEWAVLAGLREEHWPRVRQLVLEVHDRSGAEPRRIAALLRERGFDVALETEELLGGSGLHTLYARRPEARAVQAPDAASLATRLARLDAAGESFLEALHAVAGELRVPLLLAFGPHSPEAAAQPELGARLDHWTRRLADAARVLPGVDVLAADDVDALYPVAGVHDRQALELGHIPYTPAYFAALGSALARRLAARRGAPPKVIAVDADETLWTGVCGEVGALGVEIDAGRAALQEFLIDQVRAGRLLCVCSKNREEDVREVFRSHPGMRLRAEHVSAWRVDWQPKSASLRALAAELQLGLDSFVLLDDNPLECAEVAAHAPQVVVFELPREAAAAARFVRHLWLFDRGAVTAEDTRRARFYADEARRAGVRRAAPDLEQFLSALELRCEITPLAAADVERLAQLTERTNQFNLAKRPRGAAELQAHAAREGWEWLCVRVADRFGDYGLVGAMAAAPADDVLRVDTFLLSCRALGRGVEQRMLAALGRRAEELGLERVELPFVPGARNQPARDFLDALEPCEVRGSVRLIGARAAQAQKPQAAAPVAPERDEDAPGAPSVDAADRRRDPRVAARIATHLASVEQIEAALVARRREARATDRLVRPSLQGTGVVRETVGAIWSEVLGLASVGLRDDFFDLGGNSLLLVQAASRAGRVFDRRIPFEQAFKLRSVEAVAGWLEAQGAREPVAQTAPVAEPATPAGAGGSAAETPVSHAQQALFYLHQLAPGSWAYNIPFGARCARRLDAAALARAFGRLLARHALLRTTYVARKGHILALDAPAAPVDFAAIDAAGWAPETLSERLREELRRPFDLRHGPLARLRLYALDGPASALLFVTHHIAVDLWSMEIVVEDLLRLYHEEESGRVRPDPRAPAPYADFVRWQQELLAGPEGERLWSYWQRELAGELPVLKLQFTRPPAGARRFVGASHVFALDEGLDHALRALARREGATLFQVLLAGYAALLFRHTAQEDVLIGSPFGGRDPARFGGVVGDFVNLVPLRIDLAGAPTFRELLRRVGACVVRALEHQDFPFSLMVQRLRVRAEPGRTPIVQTTFALHEPNRLPELGAFFLQGNEEGRLSVHGLDLRPVGLTQQEGQFDVALELVPQGRTLRGALKYDADLLDASSAERLALRFQALLAAAAARPEAAVAALPLDTAVSSGGGAA